jgi:acetylornithine deacetylase
VRRDVNAPLGDALALARALIACDSRNPSLAADGPGEGAAANTLADTLRTWGFSVDLLDALPGRPNVIARIGGGQGGRSLILNGHLDTVGVEGMIHDPFSSEERDGRLYGRGSSDMKANVAVMCAAAARAAKHGLGGEVIVTAVIDEEYGSAGTRAVIASGITAHAAIVTEPSRLAIAPSHRGFAWLEVTVSGRAAHGSRYDIGVDAVAHAAHLIAELDVYQHQVLATRVHPLLGHASLHVGTISGGTGESIYPDRCTFTLERRTLPGESPTVFTEEVQSAIARVGARIPGFHAEIAPGLTQAPNDVPLDHPLVTELMAATAVHGEPAPIEGLSCWTDAALLSAAGIPAICYGAGDISLAHSAEEYVPIAEVTRATDVLESFIVSWCGPKGVAWGS